jgi:large subunit ribosomal protein L19
MANLVSSVENRYFRKGAPEFKPGDQIRVYFKIVEGDSERVQAFEGTVLRDRGAGLSRTITVRKLSFGIGVERIFLLNSPRIEKIEIVKKGRVRRSRLYYLRGLSGKSARIEEEKAKAQPAAAAQPAEAAPQQAAEQPAKG